MQRCFFVDVFCFFFAFLSPGRLFDAPALNSPTKKQEQHEGQTLFKDILKTKKKARLTCGDFVESLEKAEKHPQLHLYVYVYIHIYIYIDRSTNMCICVAMCICTHVSIWMLYSCEHMNVVLMNECEHMNECCSYVNMMSMSYVSIWACGCYVSIWRHVASCEHMNEGPLSPDHTEPGWGITAAELIPFAWKKKGKQSIWQKTETNLSVNKKTKTNNHVSLVV
jgi:hypothetical protein